MSSTSSINGMGEVILPNGEETGSGDIIVGSKKKKKKKIRSIEQIIDDANEEIELTEEQKILIIKVLLDDTEISKLDEGILGSILGGLGGLTFGKSIGKLLADTLGIRENSPLYSVLTSRLVATAIGAALGKNNSI